MSSIGAIPAFMTSSLQAAVQGDMDFHGPCEAHVLLWTGEKSQRPSIATTGLPWSSNKGQRQSNLTNVMPMAGKSHNQIFR